MQLGQRGAIGPGAGPLLLSGPTTDVAVTIPAGWHHVINTANPIIPEMVTPTNRMGRNEVACAGLARVATTSSPTVDATAETVRQAVTAAPGVTPGPTLSQGPARVGRLDGYRHRFSFSNTGGPLTAEVAAVPSGPAAPHPRGNTASPWCSCGSRTSPGAPPPQAIDEVVDPVLVPGARPPDR